MKITFRYGRADKRSWLTTLAGLAIIGGGLAMLFARAEGAYYIAVWATALCVALVTLLLLSKPTRIILDNDTLELRCVLDTTILPIDSIVDIVSLGDCGFDHKIPLCGSCGFLGYFGRYITLKGGHVYRVYATTRKHCVAIHTTRRRYLISCRNADLLVSLVLDTRARNAKEK